MPRTFPCPACGGAIVTFLRRGETARCGACGAAAAVQEEAVECPVPTGWIPPSAGPDAPPAPPAAPPALRDGPPPPFLAWSFVFSGLLPALFLGLEASGTAGVLAGVCGLLIALGWPWLLVFTGLSMAVMVPGPPGDGPDTLSRVLVFAGVAAALAEYPVYALVLRRAWRRGDTGRGVALLSALHLLALLLGGFLCVMFFHPV